MKKVTIGGDRLGAGKKNKVELHGYGRSTHDLSTIKRTTMSPGTLVPLLNIVSLPEDTIDIEINAHVLTNPTIGAMYGSYKFQVDIFETVNRLFIGKLQNNALNIGNHMEQIDLPQMVLSASSNVIPTPISQINPSSIFAYLGIRGIGRPDVQKAGFIERSFNAHAYLAYFEIFKNYYANKQEEMAYIIHSDRVDITDSITKVETMQPPNTTKNILNKWPLTSPSVSNQIGEQTRLYFTHANATPPKKEEIVITITDGIAGVGTSTRKKVLLGEMFKNITNESATSTIYNVANTQYYGWLILAWDYINAEDLIQEEPKLRAFPLENIDKMREIILGYAIGWNNITINKNGVTPYSYGLQITEDGLAAAQATQEGLLVKTYQNDIFNNWIKTEWIDGELGINELTKIDTSEGSFTIDQLNIANKVYMMLNRIAISGGTYDDYLDTVYDMESIRKTNTPIYHGGLSKEIVFEEVISQAESPNKPLGQIAGRGTFTNKHKGGKVVIHPKEHGNIMAIVSITPRIDYYQGNAWDVNLKTMDDFHKPQLDEIGFQDVITDRFIATETIIDDAYPNLPIFKSIGKQPAWIEYMTAVNEVYGNFAINDNMGFMVLKREYETDSYGELIDGTTYIDPSKYNYVFAETALDAMNFQVQVEFKITARRKMSAKVMPNL